MTDADQNHPPADIPEVRGVEERARGADGGVDPVPPFRSSLSTLAAGMVAIGALSVLRALLIGPDADRPARLLLLMGGVGVPFSLLAVLGARSIDRHHRRDPMAFVAATGIALAAALVGGFGLSLLLGAAADPDYRVPLWQIETEPIVTLIVGLAAAALAIGSRGRAEVTGDGSPTGSVARRRVTAVIGACVAMPLVRRLLGRAGDEGLSVGWTALLILFDLAALVLVAGVAYRGFGVGRDLPAQYRAARADVS